MTHTPHAAADNGGPFDPSQAAALLDRATQQARRRLAPSPPWLLETRALMVLAALGAVWLSVRGQHPYRGPTTADIPVLIAFIVVNFAATVAVRHRALTGVQGRSRLRPSEITVAALAWIAAPVMIVVLAAAGVTYSEYPTTVLIIPGLAWAVLMAARADWRDCANGTAVVVVGVVGLFAGPAGSWAVAGVGLCAVLLGQAAVATARQQRR
ncbi:hypothetical protein ACPPVS_02570 [Cellulomonas sp. McL0617]|uniref:hypothetical protein n=1 Tax=Cellulomonas sp. McL0617 TaxID=3415675 RepID=UPI003CEE675A